MTILAKAGWDRRGMVEMFELLRREAGRDPGSVESFLSSHPSPEDRIASLARAARVKGGRRDSEQFRSAQARLARRSGG
jgi:predicted Zn-dependent protease